MTPALRTVALASALAVAGLSTPARADSGAAPQRDDGAVRTKPNRALLRSGILFLGVPYTASIVVATTSDRKADKNLYVPVAGPWMDLSSRECPVGQTCKNDGLYNGMLIANGVFQGLGALQVIGSFLFPDKVQSPNPSTAKDDAQKQKESLKVRFAPSYFAGGYGLVASGKFY